MCHHISPKLRVLRTKVHIRYFTKYALLWVHVAKYCNCSATCNESLQCQILKYLSKEFLDCLKMAHICQHLQKNSLTELWSRTYLIQILVWHTYWVGGLVNNPKKWNSLWDILMSTCFSLLLWDTHTHTSWSGLPPVSECCEASWNKNY
jgi:hypothetical protein